MNNRSLHPHKQHGITLLEILVSVLIGSILIIAITSMYGNFIGANRLQQEQSDAQDQANFAFLALNRAVRMAGAGLCVKPTVKENTYLHQPTDFNAPNPDTGKAPSYPPLLTSNGLTKFSSQSRLRSFAITAGTPSSDLSSSLALAPDSDALLVIYSDSHIRRIGGTDAASAENSSRFDERRLITPRTSDDPVFNYNNSNELQTTWIMMSDCDHTGVFRYSPKRFESKAPNVLPVPDNGNFAYNFGGKNQDVLIAKLHAQLFFVAKDSNNISQLYVKNLLSPDSNAQPLSAYVEKMIIEYKEGSNWVRQPTDWNQNFPIRVTLTMKAGNDIGEQTYTRVLGVRN